MGKTRIGERISKGMAETGETSQQDRSHEVAAFNEKFLNFSKAFKPLSSALKNHHAQLKKLEKSQNEVSAELSKWIKGTPIAVAENNPVTVQQVLLNKDKVHSEKYLRDVVDYVHEWELVVRTRVEAAQKQVKESKQSLDHYGKKLDSLAKHHEATVSRGKTPDPKDVEKLKRNEEKLALAKDSHAAQANRLCDLIETIVDLAWKDLIPVLLHMMKIDSDNLERKHTMMASSNIVQNLRDLAEEYKIDLTTPPPGPVEKIGAPAAGKAATARKVATDGKVAPLKQQ